MLKHLFLQCLPFEFPHCDMCCASLCRLPDMIDLACNCTLQGVPQPAGVVYTCKRLAPELRRAVPPLPLPRSAAPRRVRPLL